MSKHSPGPWRVEEDWTFEVYDSQGALLANVREAQDALLIAAAPDLSKERDALAARVKELETDLAQEREEAQSLARQLLAEKERRARLEAALTEIANEARLYRSMHPSPYDEPDYASALLAAVHDIRECAGLDQEGT